MMLVYLISWFSIMGWTMNNWLMIWYLMEVCLVLFVGLCTSGKGYSVSEVMMSYYLVQSIFSLIMLVFILFYMFNLFYLCSFILILGLMAKMGLFPLHFWFILICGKLDWISFFTLSTLMKLIPLILLYYLFSTSSFYFVMISSSFFGSLLGLNNSAIQKTMGFSSMITVCWFIYSMSISLNLFFFYFISYVNMLFWLVIILNKYSIFYINQFKFNSMNLNMKIMIFIYGLSISGFPPFLGFLVKWLAINYFWWLGFKFLVSLMILVSVLSVYFYLQMFFYIMLMFSSWVKWYTNNFGSFGLLSFLFLMSYIILFMLY
uniref:NADH-ubiquinone oxidoreductase chain 2 n=1 Tax=Bemisia tabaci TaxID=7038 RepID=A0A345U6C6_BEMTA|nr:NADH dehydrogenase subunit 2 [Bemisia tabaci]AXI96012.1 NADH dehydrogenase subunit 2 [Bemisia tabaci]